MNFGCAMWRIQDELWEMTQNEYEQEEDGNSLWLSSPENGLKIQAARAVRCGVRMATARAY
jgi:hypothetical protein